MKDNNFEINGTNNTPEEFSNTNENVFDEFQETVTDATETMADTAEYVADTTETMADTSEYVADTTETMADEADSFEQDGTYHFKGSDIPAQDAYSSTDYNTQSSYNNDYNTQGYNTDSQYGYGGYNPYNTNNGEYTQQNTENTYNAQNPQKAKKPKKEKKPVSRGAIAFILVIAIVFSSVLGFAGGYVALKLFDNCNGLVVNKAISDDGSTPTDTKANVSGLTASIVNKTADSVVEITTETVSTGSYFQQYISTGAGSGVIISQDGNILTNNHVIDGANNIKVTLRDGKVYEAKVIGKDATLDIALLKIDAEGLSCATYGDSSDIQVGDYVVVIGNPLGQLGGTVTDGIISALDRDVMIGGETMSLLQTNAAINPGNSGGGMFNSNGELIGIICAKASSSTTEVEGLGFAIPIKDVLNVIENLKEYGYVKGRIDLGMKLQDVSSSQVYQPGVYVSDVTKGSSADKANFRIGDLITQVNGEDVDSVASLNKIIDTLSIGDNVKFTVIRGSEKGNITMTLEEYTPDKNTLTDSGNNPFSQNEQDDYSGRNPFLW